MKSSEYNRRVELFCPTCGGDEYESDEDVQDPMALLKCASCGREITHEELVSENEANIQQHAAEMKQKIAKDFQKEVRKRLQKAFSGNKHIRFK